MLTRFLEIILLPNAYHSTVNIRTTDYMDYSKKSITNHGENQQVVIRQKALRVHVMTKV